MIILGVDPGIALTGWCVLDVPDTPLAGVRGVLPKTSRSSSPLVCAIGCIRTNNDSSFSQGKSCCVENISRRLVFLGESLAEIIRRWHPTSMAIEELFFLKKSPSTLSVAEARGVLLYVASREGVPVFEYNPRSVKISLTGSGSADKMQMQKMVQRILNLTEIPKPDDAADAAAIALCHYFTTIRGGKTKII